jgi:hypothetical protein
MAIWSKKINMQLSESVCIVKRRVTYTIIVLMLHATNYLFAALSALNNLGGAAAKSVVPLLNYEPTSSKDLISLLDGSTFIENIHNDSGLYFV